MGYVVRIRKNATGEIRYCPQDLEWEEHHLWWWTEGNFGCDCSRDREFCRAGGENDDRHIECSEGLFSALDATLPGGKVIELDEPIKCEELLGEAIRRKLDKATTPDGGASSP